MNAEKESAKGARKKALELMATLGGHERAVVEGAVELENAKRRLAYVTRERDIVVQELKNLIERCMPSLGSDEGK